MAVAWTTIPNGDVDVDSPVSTALMTALRDNPEGIAQRATGAPKIFGCPYAFSEFTASGTWTKPANAQSGDRVIVYCVGGGGSGENGGNGSTGGSGGGGAIHMFLDIDDLSATEAVVVGAGGSGVGDNGGQSSFGTINTATWVAGQGGSSGLNGGSGVDVGGPNGGNPEAVDGNSASAPGMTGGNGGASNNSSGSLGIGGASIYGGGGGGGAGNSQINAGPGGFSAFAGRGGDADLTISKNGTFPGGGGAGRDSDWGTGANGVVRVWCMREEA